MWAGAGLNQGSGAVGCKVRVDMLHRVRDRKLRSCGLEMAERLVCSREVYLYLSQWGPYSNPRATVPSPDKPVTSGRREVGIRDE